jgi:hypothetical protein
MRNSLLKSQEIAGALQEQVSHEFSSMICLLLRFKFRFKARLSGLRTQTVKLGKHAPHVHRDTPVPTKWKFDQIFEFAWYRIWPMPSWAPYSFEESHSLRFVTPTEFDL